MRILKRVFEFLIIGSFSLVIAACYGMPIGIAYRWVRAVDGNGDPIPGLLLTSPDVVWSEVNTDENGEAPLDFYASAGTTYTLTDVDGTASGGEFADAQFVLGEEEITQVTMEPAGSSTRVSAADTD